MTYSTVADMKSDLNIKENDKLKVWGYYSVGDGGYAEYVAINTTTTENKITLITLNNGLKAKLVDRGQGSWYYFPYFLESTNNKWTPNERPINNKDLWGMTATDVYQWFDNLMTDNPQYITSFNWGKDTSGIYDLKYYVFDPKNTNKTIILGAGMHGLERTSVIDLCYIAKILCTVGLIEPSLYDLRYKTKIIIMPCENPWGYSQPVSVRGNSNNVDINRNFDYKWAEYDISTGYGEGKGTSAFSEKESQFVRDVIIKYSLENVVAYIDMHCGSPQSAQTSVVINQNAQNLGAVNNTFSYLKTKYPTRTTTIAYSENPTGFNWCMSKMGIESLNPEWYDTSVGGGTANRIEMQTSCEWYLNLILEHTRSQALLYKERHICLVHDPNTCNTSGIPSQTASTSYVEIPNIKYSFKPYMNGTVKVYGRLELKNDNTASLNFINPKCTQPTNPFNATFASGASEAYWEGDKRNDIAFNYFQIVQAYDGTANTEVTVSFDWKASVGTLTLWRAFIFIDFIPNKHTSTIVEVGSLGTNQKYPVV